jgi:hypothetical protein
MIRSNFGGGSRQAFIVESAVAVKMELERGPMKLQRPRSLRVLLGSAGEPMHRQWFSVGQTLSLP